MWVCCWRVFQIELQQLVAELFSDYLTFHNRTVNLINLENNLNTHLKRNNLTSKCFIVSVLISASPASPSFLSYILKCLSLQWLQPRRLVLLTEALMRYVASVWAVVMMTAVSSKKKGAERASQSLKDIMHCIMVDSGLRRIALKAQDIRGALYCYYVSSHGKWFKVPETLLKIFFYLRVTWVYESVYRCAVPNTCKENI